MSQLLIHLRGNSFQAGGIQQTFSDRGLIRNNDHGQAERGELLQRLSNSRHEDKLRPVQYIVAGTQKVDDAVAVDEDCRASGAFVYFRKEYSQQVLFLLQVNF